jgi:hypothetical protein
MLSACSFPQRETMSTLTDVIWAAKRTARVSDSAKRTTD